jgi:predicted ATPase
VRELPTGTVTFLFTDIEGSTRLLHEYEGRYAELLSEHRRALRRAFVQHGGVEVDTQGDAFFVAFARAADAAAAAVDGQAALSGGPVRVRMGLHTGEPTVADDGYVGVDIHRAARIAAAGHDGQVLLSQPTRDLLAGVTVRDLGEHRLKDLSAPERLFQLGEGDFPRLKTLHQTNLPIPATPFLGRQRELDDVLRLLRDANVRLLTLTGPGGTGKTRLALQAAAEVAEDMPDGVWWVSLSPLRDPSLALDAVASTLDVRERPGFTVEETLADALAAKRALLLLDNAEHLLPQVASHIARIRTTDGPRILVTSRERLQLDGEHAWPVPSLDEQDGTALFTARARALRPTFTATPATGELCARLDNLPLALELAAARVPIFSPEELLERIGKGVELKGGRDADPRQQTLDATIRWSYDLLTPEEQRLFAGLAVFVGGCTYEAAEDVCGADADTLQSLIDKSLVRSREGAGSGRYWMLETIRTFAAAELEASGEADALRLRHAQFLAAFAERADPHLRHGPDQQRWVSLFAADYDNVRAAMSYALVNDLTLALRLVGRLTFFLYLRGGFAEAKAWLDEILPRAAGRPQGLLGRAHECGAMIAFCTGDRAGQAEHSDNAYAAFVAAGDDEGIADAIRERGKTASQAGDIARANTIYAELAQHAERIGDHWNAAIAMNNLGSTAIQSGDFERAIELCNRSGTLRREIGDESGLALALCNVAFAEVRLGRLTAAETSLHEALETSMRIDAKIVVGCCLDVSVEIVAARGRLHEAARIAGAATRLQEELGSARDPFEEGFFERAVEALRQSLGPETAAAEIERGRELSLDDVAALALASMTQTNRA